MNSWEPNLRACLHGGGAPQVGEVKYGRSPHLSCKRDRVTPPKRVTSPTWGPHLHVNRWGGPQVGKVTCGGLPHVTYKRDQIKIRDYMDRRVTPPKRVTSPTWGPPPPCKQALKKRKKNSSKCVHVLRIIHKTSRGGISRCRRAVASKKCTEKVCCTCTVVFSGPLCFCFFFSQIKASLSQQQTNF